MSDSFGIKGLLRIWASPVVAFQSDFTLTWALFSIEANLSFSS